MPNKIEIRKCSYNPAADVRPTVYEFGSSEKVDYLDTKYRVFWFNAYCEEHGVSGYIDDSEIQFHTFGSIVLVAATATVYTDGKIVGKSSASRLINGDLQNDMTIVGSVCTMAKGRALANAGFGTLYSGTANETGHEGPESSEVKEIPCDSGISKKEKSQPITPITVIPVPPTTTQVTIPVTGQRAVKPQSAPPVQSSASVPTATRQAVSQPEQADKRPAQSPACSNMTLDEALKFVIKTGLCRGKTMEEAVKQNQSAVIYCAKSSNPELATAAKLVLDWYKRTT